MALDTGLLSADGTASAKKKLKGIVSVVCAFTACGMLGAFLAGTFPETVPNQNGLMFPQHELIEKLFDRTPLVSLHHDELDNATLGKNANLAIPRSRPTLGAARSISKATLGMSASAPWAGSLPQFKGRRTKVSVYAISQNEIDALAALPATADQAQVALSMLREAPAEWLSWYNDKAIEFPLMTKATTSGVCYSIGDLCAQGIAGKNISTVDLTRSARSGAAGFVGYGPPAHYWLNFLDQYMSFGGAWWAVFPKIALTQGPMSVVYNTLYSLCLGFFAFRNPIKVLQDVKDAAVPGFIAAIKFWPAVHLVTFSVVPIQLQVLWVDLAEIVYICILSGINNEGLEETKQKLEESKVELKQNISIQAG